MSENAVSLPPNAKDAAWAVTALLLGGVAIGSSPIFVRLSEVGPIATAFWRLALALIPLAIWSASKTGSRQASDRPRGWADYTVLSFPGVMLAGDLIAWHLALHMTSVANATLLTNIAPIFATLGAWLLFGAVISRAFVMGLGVALVGMVVLKGGISGFGRDGNLGGDLTALVAAAFYAGYFLAVSRLRNRFSTLTIMLWSSASAALVTLPFALVYETALFPVTLYGWAILIGLAWITHAAGQGLIAFALAWLSVAFSTMALFIQPIVASLLAWLILAEPITEMQAVGGVIVLTGIFIAKRTQAPGN